MQNTTNTSKRLETKEVPNFERYEMENVVTTKEVKRWSCEPIPQAPQAPVYSPEKMQDIIENKVK